MIEKAGYLHERVLVRLDKAKAPASNEESSQNPYPTEFGRLCSTVSSLHKDKSREASE